MTAVEDTRAAWWPSPFGAEDEIGMLNHLDGGHSDDQGSRKSAYSVSPPSTKSVWPVM
jgi:hypothetical protein